MSSSRKDERPPPETELEAEDAKLAAEAADALFLAENGYSLSWPATRLKLAKILTSTACDLVLGAIVVFNMAVVIAETDHGAKNTDEPNFWIGASNSGLLAFYTLELAIRLYTFRLQFFKVTTNLLDFTLVSVDWLMMPLAAILGDLVPVSFLRIFRLARLARSTKIMQLSPELTLIVSGLRDTLKTLLWGAMMILLMLTVWSILAVEFIHPINLEVAEQTGDYDGCVRCARAYESVFQSNLTLFQSLIAGDSWGLVTIPVIERKPLTALFFCSVHITISIGLMNLILAVIVDRASAARASDVAALERSEEREAVKLKGRLVKMCSEMDKDCSGVIQLEELIYGYKHHADFRLCMKAMDIEEADMRQVFCMLDDDASGVVHYDEFAEQVWKMKSTDDHTLLLFLKFGMCEIKAELDKEMTQLRKEFGILNEAFGAHSERMSQFMSSSDPTKESKQTDILPPVVEPQQSFKDAKLDSELPAKLLEPDSIRDDMHTLRQLTMENSSMMKQLLACTTAKMSQDVIVNPRCRALPGCWSSDFGAADVVRAGDPQVFTFAQGSNSATNSFDPGSRTVSGAFWAAGRS